MKTLCLFVPAFLLLVSCSGKASLGNTSEKQESTASGPLVTVPFEKGIETEKELKLSEIADRVDYIPLETNAKGLISYIKKISLTKEYIFIYDIKNGILQFDRQGKFVRNIARKGQGPGEYIYIADFQIDEPSKRVYILSGHSYRMLTYGFDGDFIREVNLPKEISEFVLAPDSVFTSYKKNSTGYEKTRLIRSDMKGDTLSYIPYIEAFTMDYPKSSSSAVDNELYLMDGNVRLKEIYNDTLFTVLAGGLKPEYIINMGSHKLPEDKQYEKTKGEGEIFFSYASQYLRMMLFETRRHLFFLYTTWNFKSRDGQQPKMAVYNKSTDDCFRITGNCIKNDIDYGGDVYPSNYQNNTFVINLEAPEVVRELQQKDTKFTRASDPIFKNIKEDDNPVLMIIHLKE